jgi:hypothetical protein
MIEATILMFQPRDHHVASGQRTEPWFSGRNNNTPSYLGPDIGNQSQPRGRIRRSGGVNRLQSEDGIEASRGQGKIGIDLIRMGSGLGINLQ